MKRLNKIAKAIMSAALTTLFCTVLSAQTNPVAQSLPYTQDFGTTTFSSLPAGMAAWTVNLAPLNSETDAVQSTPNGDATISPSNTPQVSSGCFGHEISGNGRFYIQGGGSSTDGSNQLVLSINTLGWNRVFISYDVEIISPNAKAMGVILQYRKGSSGSWVNVPLSNYLHSNSDRNAGDIDTFANLTLPTHLRNDSIVQLRWATWNGTMAGSYSGIGIDNIAISASSAGGDQSLWLCGSGDVNVNGGNFGPAAPFPVPVISGITAVSAGGVTHCLALDGGGNIYGWGDNSYGECGFTGTGNYINPVLVSGISGASAISAGDGHSLAIVGGVVYAWGNNNSGQLGNGTASTSTYYYPTAITTLPPNIVAISAGTAHSLALDASGNVWAWGWNFYGQLGIGSLTTPIVTPVMVFSGAQAISAGEGSSLILAGGLVYGSGFNGPGGQLGNGSTVSTNLFVASTSFNLYAPFSKISTSNFSFALGTDGTIYACGENFWGELGNGTNITNTAVSHLSLTCITEINAGWFHAQASNSSGAGFGWGLNDVGQVGVGTFGGSYNTPQSITVGCILQIPVLTVTGINAICSGSNIVLTVSGGIVPYTWAGAGIISTTTNTATVSPSSTTTYTVTDACAISTTFTVTVSPTPSVTLSAFPSSFCVGGGTTTLTALGATTYTWSAGATSTGVNTATASPTITTTYTVTGTTAGCPATATVTVTVNPNSTVNSLPDLKFCNGDIAGPINFTSTPTGATFTWTNSNTAIGLGAAGTGNIPAFTATNLTATPIAGTVTVFPSFGSCPGTPTSFVIVVFPSPTVSAIASPTTIPLGASSLLTASGAAAYTWSNGATGNPITVFPATTTTYTVTGTNQNGCSSIATVTVTVINYPCTAIVPSTPVSISGGVIPNGATSLGLFGSGIANLNGNFKIVGTFTVNTEVVTVNCNFIMEQSAIPGSIVPNIQVINKLTLSQNTHIYSCTTMWDGIYVNSGSSIRSLDNVIIEDAIQAINIAQGAVLPITPAGCSIQATVFNRNLYAIKLPSNNATTTPVKITNSIITCRQLIFTSSSPGGMPTVASIKPILALANPSAILSPLNLRPPYAAQKAFVGVFATDVNNLTIGDDLPVSASGSINVFDAIMIGINIENPTKPNTTANIYHNTFQFILGVGTFCMSGFPCTISRGFGINAVGMNNTGSNKITVGGTSAQGNSFRNTYRAVNISNYQTITAQRNSITNVTTGPFPFGVVNYGNGGIFVIPAAQASNILIADQLLIKNCATAVWVSHAAGATTGLSLLRINNNGTSPTSPGITSDATATAYCTNGIFVTDLLSNTTPHSLWAIKNNFITATNNCIFLTNVKKPAASTTIYDLFSNSCNARYIATGILTGIKAVGSKGITITNNHTNYTAGSTAYIYPTGNITAYGLYLQQSSNMYVGCNLFENAGRSMVFEGNCTSTSLPGFGITTNTMRRAQDGFVLKNNGIIGTQGSSTVASNNFWDMSAGGAPNFTFSEIFTDLTGGAPSNANVFSKLYMNNITTGSNATMPVTIPAASSLSKTNTGAANAYILGTGLNTTSAVSTPCTGTPPPALASSSMSPAEIASQAAFLKTIEEDSTLLPLYNDETRWQRRKYVFDEVDENPAYAVNPGLASFHAVNMGSPFDKFSLVDKKIALGQYAAASSINNSITPVNIVESNQQTVNNQILQQLLAPGYIYSAADISTLSAIAYQCPLQGGNSVYQARVLLMNIANDVIEFFDNCDKEVVRSMDSTPQSIGNEVASAYKLYPNPNDGNMIFEYSLLENSIGRLLLYDVTGRLMSSYELSYGQEKLLQIKESELKNGIYFYSVIIDNKVKAQNKIVIVK